MSIKKELFGRLECGTEVYAYTLSNETGIEIKIISWGGAIVSIKAPDRYGRLTDIVGGYDSLDYYVMADGYQGALIGRWGNRIGNARFALDGKEYALFANDGKNHLHGGKRGFDARVWDVDMRDGKEPCLALHTVSCDGEEGYPGTLDVTVTYTLNSKNGLLIHYEATTDKATVVNLTNHAYFNLRGYASGSVCSHTLWVDADSFLPTDEGLIPTGEIRSVEGTALDFRTPKEIGRDIDSEAPEIKMAGGYDHCLCFTGGQTSEPVKRAELYDGESGRLMEVYTDQPCVQIYSGNFLTNAEFAFKGGYPQTPRTFICLETERMPDSMNHEGFTECVLRPGEAYVHTTEYRFLTK